MCYHALMWKAYKALSLSGLCIITGSIAQMLMMLTCKAKAPDVDCAGADDIVIESDMGDRVVLQCIDAIDIQMKDLTSNETNSIVESLNSETPPLLLERHDSFIGGTLK